MSGKDFDKELIQIEESLLMNDNSFGLLTTMGYYEPKTDTDIEEYMLCTAIANHRIPGVSIGRDLWIQKDKEIRVCAEDLVKVFDLFRKLKRELVCELHEDVNTFSLPKYIERIRKLDQHIQKSNGKQKQEKGDDLNVTVKEGEGTTEGIPTWYLEYSSWCSDSYINNKPEDRDVKFFKDGIIAERNRIYDMLPNIVKDEKILEELDRALGRLNGNPR